MNLVEAALDRAGDGVVARFGTHELRLTGAAAAGVAGHAGGQVILGFRPEDLADATLTGAALTSSATPGARLTVLPEIREDMGAEVLIHFALGVPPVRRRDVIEGAEPEDPAHVELGARSAIPFVARLARGTNAKEGEQLELAVDTARLHVFDPVTGEALS
jgi:multiple sugar transport system ATP-binding protein